MLSVGTVRYRCVQWLVVSLLVVAGCAHRKMPPSELQIEPLPPFSDTGQATTSDRWWTTFDDPKLDDQINHALDNNFTLAAALQRIFAARALTRREASDLWPDLNGVINPGGNFGPGEDRTSVAWGLDAAYQVDLWGAIESRVAAQSLRADATDADYHAIALTLSAEVVRTWFSLIEARAQVELLKVQIETNRTGLELQESRFGEGLIRLADALRQRQLLESTLEQAVVAESRIEVLEHRLAVLLGEMPQTASYDTGAQLPTLPPLPKTGLPSELLHRRPDVRRDYLAFQAADRDLASAISSRYPRLNLTGSLLNVAERPETLFRDWFVSIGSQLISPLFDGGQRRAEVDRTSAVKCQLFNQYGQTMLTALREVEDSLAQEKFQVQRIEHLKEQVKLAGQASNLLREQYFIQDAEYLDFLSAITGQQSLQRQLLSAQLDLILFRISLYLALGGDFEPTANRLQFVQEISPNENSDSPDSDSPDSEPNQTTQDEPNSQDEEISTNQPELNSTEENSSDTETVTDE